MLHDYRLTTCLNSIPQDMASAERHKILRVKKYVNHPVFVLVFPDKGDWLLIEKGRVSTSLCASP